MTDLLIVISVARPAGLTALNGLDAVADKVVEWGHASGFEVADIRDSQPDATDSAKKKSVDITTIRAELRKTG